MAALLCHLLPWLLWVSMATSQQQSRIASTDQLPEECRLPVDKCEPLPPHSACLDVQLPYQYTSTILANDSDTQQQVQDKLILWSGLQSVPKCWDVIQPLLCAVYMPKCNPGNDSGGGGAFIELPGKDLCDITRSPCQIVARMEGWPDFLQCHQKHFKEACKDTASRDLEFNTSGACRAPLVATSNKASWFHDVEGCGIQCENPLFTDEEHRDVHIFIAVCGSVCMLCTFITILTFLIDWKNASRYPALILFFINCCFFIGSVGWMAQFLPGARQDIVCRHDGTWRQSEPQLGSGESASCTIIFILVYFPMMAAITWFVILAFAWHLIFRALGSPRDVLEGKRGHFHLVAWSVPLVLTIVCLALTQVEGDSLSGICFVGYMNHAYRGCFVLLPVGIVIVVGMGFLLSGLVTLIKMRLGTPGYVSNKASAKIRDTIIRLGIFSFLAFLFVTVTFIVHVYIFLNESKWEESFIDYVYCETQSRVSRLISNETTSCKMEDRPNMIALQIHIFAYFGAGIGMSSWVWNASTAQVWKRFFRKLRHKPERKPVKLRKHQVIAQAFRKRGEMHLGRLSLSFHSTHDDPLGMKFDINSISSHEMSSAWAAAIPRMIMRRGGLVQRRHSDSDWESVQSTTRRMSFESHCLSIGSQSHLSQSHVSQVVPSPASHASIPSEQEDSSRKKKRRKRRKRARNRIMPMGTPNSLTLTSGCISTDPGSFASSDKRRGSIGSSIKQSSDRHADNESSDSASSVDRCRLPPGGHVQLVQATVESQPEDCNKPPPTEEVPLATHPKKILVAECEHAQNSAGFEATVEGQGQDESQGPLTSTPNEDLEPKPSTSGTQQQVRRKNSPVPAPVATQHTRWRNPFVSHRHRVHPVASGNLFMPQMPHVYQNPWHNPFITQHMMYGGPYMYNNLVVPPRDCSPFSQHYSPYSNAQPFGMCSPYSQPSGDCVPQPQLPGECVQESTQSGLSGQQRVHPPPWEAKGGSGVKAKSPGAVDPVVGQPKSPGRVKSPQVDTPPSSKGPKSPGRVKTPRADTPPPGRGQLESPQIARSPGMASPPPAPTHQASALHAQTTSTYSMFTASSCLPDVETPLGKGSWLSGSQGSGSGARPIGSWLSGSEFMGSGSEMKPIESWLAGLEVEDEGAQDRRNSGKRPKKRPKIKSKDQVIAINLKPTSSDVD